jgi:hypothetical protein
MSFNMGSMSLLDGATTAKSVRQLLCLSSFQPPILPLAIATILTIMSGAPFHGQKDVDQGIAYISVVIVFFMVSSCSLFSCGCYHRTHVDAF